MRCGLIVVVVIIIIIIVTVVSPLAASYVDRAATDAGTVADMAATRKTEKYSTLSSAYRFEPIAVENLGVSIMLQRFNSVLLHGTLPVDLPDL